MKRWIAAFPRDEIAGLTAHPVPARTPKLTTAQEKVVGCWLADDPTKHGFIITLWTGPRLEPLIEQEFGIRLLSDYLAA